MDLPYRRKPGVSVRIATSSLVVFVAGLFAGCQGDKEPSPTVAASGLVLLDGKPAADVILVFHSADSADPRKRPYARSGADGQFAVSTFQPGDGAPPGRYRVTAMLLQEEEGHNLLPVRYTNPATSNLNVEIGDSATEIPPIELVSR